MLELELEPLELELEQELELLALLELLDAVLQGWVGAYAEEDLEHLLCPYCAGHRHATQR
jgi:hypothetical protein